MKKWHHIICLLFIFIALEVKAQLDEAFVLESSFHFGKIVKHRETINFPVNGPSYGIEISPKWQTRGKKEWQEHQRYPKLGFSFIAFKLGEKEVLGNAFGVFPNVAVNVFRKNDWQLHFQMGTGMAWITNYFDPVSNPENNAISSNVNNLTSFKFYLERRINPKQQIILGASFSHFSNGGAKLPNLGVNIPTISLGLNHSKQVLSYKDYYSFESPKKEEGFKLNFDLYADLAFQEIRIYGGPRYPVYISGLAAKYHLNKINRLVLGYQYEFNKSMYKFGQYVFQYNSEKEARQGASRHMIFFGNEFLFGDWSVQLQSGGYLFQKRSLLLPKEFYFKLSAKYYLPPVGKPATKFYVNLSLKSHLFVADYMSFGIGAEF